MALPRSLSLEKLAAALFAGEDLVCQEYEREGESWGRRLAGKSDGCDFGKLGFERCLSEGSTALGRPLSRHSSSAGSDDEQDECYHGSRLVAAPQVAGLLRGTVTDSGPAVLQGQGLIAVQPNGEASFVPEEQQAALLDEAAECAAAARPCKSSLVLVSRDGTAVMIEDGENLEWEKLDSLLADAQCQSATQPEAQREKGQAKAATPLACCAAARALSPLQLLEEEAESEICGDAGGCHSRQPDGWLPRSKSLKRLSELLFVAGAQEVGPRAAFPDPEELELEAARAPAARPQPPSSWFGSCSLQ